MSQITAKVLWFYNTFIGVMRVHSLNEDDGFILWGFILGILERMLMEGTKSVGENGWKGQRRSQNAATFDGYN